MSEELFGVRFELDNGLRGRVFPTEDVESEFCDFYDDTHKRKILNVMSDIDKNRNLFLRLDGEWRHIGRMVDAQRIPLPDALLKRIAKHEEAKKPQQFAYRQSNKVRPPRLKKALFRIAVVAIAGAIALTVAFNIKNNVISSPIDSTVQAGKNTQTTTENPLYWTLPGEGTLPDVPPTVSGQEGEATQEKRESVRENLEEIEKQSSWNELNANEKTMVTKWASALGIKTNEASDIYNYVKKVHNATEEDMFGIIDAWGMITETVATEMANQPFETQVRVSQAILNRYWATDPDNMKGIKGWDMPKFGGDSGLCSLTKDNRTTNFRNHLENSGEYSRVIGQFANSDQQWNQTKTDEVTRAVLTALMEDDNYPNKGQVSWSNGPANSFVESKRNMFIFQDPNTENNVVVLRDFTSVMPKEWNAAFNEAMKGFKANKLELEKPAMPEITNSTIYKDVYARYSEVANGPVR